MMRRIEAIRHSYDRAKAGAEKTLQDVNRALEYRAAIHELWTSFHEHALTNARKNADGDLLFAGLNHMPPDDDVRAWHAANAVRMTAMTALSARFTRPDLIVDITDAEDLAYLWSHVNEVSSTDQRPHNALIVGETCDMPATIRRAQELNDRGIPVLGAAFLVDHGGAQETAEWLGKPVAAAIRLVHGDQGTRLMDPIQASRMLQPAA
ncbi:hypothetical protein HYS00_02665 [Candidatus Microgenomates bacterium]|nr:hypothetical protein [Candidatus Microgenomates bacterium]